MNSQTIHYQIYIRIQNIYEALPPCTLRAVPSLICYMRALPSFMRAFALIHMRPCCCILPLPHPTCLPWACNPLSLSFSLFIYTYILKMQNRFAAAYFWSKSCGKTKPNMPLWTGPRCNEYSSLYQMNIHLYTR